MASRKSRKIAFVTILCFEIILIILFSIFVYYDPEAEPFFPMDFPNNTLESQYPMFQDIHVMIFVGFGFLMTFLRRYAFGALGLTFFVAALVMQWGLLCHGFFRMTLGSKRIHLNMISLITADETAGAVLISFGVLIGKVSTIQLIVVAILETTLFCLNEFVGAEILHATDTGGSMFVHVFGAYFGLAVSFTLKKNIKDVERNVNNLESSVYESDVSAMIGSLFLWVFWPSFNAATVSGGEKYRAVINTYLAMTASCLAAFAMSSAVSKHGKFDMVHIQNATLAGGVCVGTVASMMIQPYGALLVGGIGGVLSTLGYHRVQGFILRKLRIHDTCGVNNLHGMPGIVAGVLGALWAWMADDNVYGISLYVVFPAMGPILNRTSTQQAIYQLVALVSSFLISAVGGLITGLCIRNFRKVEKMFDDEALWHIPDDDDKSLGTFTDVKKF